MILMTGILLISSLLCLVPQTQIRISNFFGFKRQKIVFFGILLIALWDYAIFRSVNISFGLFCLAVSSIMMFVVPRNEKVRDWMKEILFEGVDILDKEAPHAKIVGLFKFPLFCLGLWLTAPWSIALVEILPIVVAFGVYFYRTKRLPKIIQDTIDEYKKEGDTNNSSSSTTII